MPHTIDAGPSRKVVEGIIKNPASKQSEANEHRLKNLKGKRSRLAKAINKKHEQGESKAEERAEHRM